MIQFVSQAQVHHRCFMYPIAGRTSAACFLMIGSVVSHLIYASSASAAGQRPNIMIIMADDK